MEGPERDGGNGGQKEVSGWRGRKVMAAVEVSVVFEAI